MLPVQIFSSDPAIGWFENKFDTQAELEAKVPPAPVRRKKSKLRSFLNYQTTQQMHLVTEEVIVKGRPLKEDAK
jgi:hypothetical protein